MTPKRLKELTKLVNSKWSWDRTKAAQALDLPLELQEVLAKDEYSGVRYKIAMNTSVVNVKIQEILARDEDWAVRSWLADNSSFTDRKLWELLRNDENQHVRNVMQARLEYEKDRIKAEFKEKINERNS